ncbi:hypothetical protein [Lysobacter silvisoli]|uniref:Uncharacterized protein n=1 Tax=Lysobacter silvisoli TaxID=2293254 RepID=A0A371K2G9_9GAMM|nr:hypothetical protein [Lysobacter silvisoli]RDZ28113.1 hypothetical protein DX914_02920 [Lysobacter silvisoli]
MRQTDYRFVAASDADLQRLLPILREFYAEEHLPYFPNALLSASAARSTLPYDLALPPGRIMRRSLAALLILSLCAACATAQAAEKLDDPRSNGYLSPRERSLCEAPEWRRDWCEQPHEVRAFLSRYDECEHWRGEEAPQGDAQRAQEIVEGANESCKGNDLRLRELRQRYKNVPAVAAALSALEFNYGP